MSVSSTKGGIRDRKFHSKLYWEEKQLIHVWNLSFAVSVSFITLLSFTYTHIGTQRSPL